MAHVNVYPSHISPMPMGNRPFPESSLRTTKCKSTPFFTDVDDTSMIDDYCYYVVILLARIFPMPNISVWVTILAADS
jgi:hypothetical protein